VPIRDLNRPMNPTNDPHDVVIGSTSSTEPPKDPVTTDDALNVLIAR
jgi:hypothetical protein